MSFKYFLLILLVLITCFYLVLNLSFIKLTEKDYFNLMNFNLMNTVQNLLNSYQININAFAIINDTKKNLLYDNDSLNEFREIHAKIIGKKLPLRVTFNGYTDGGYGNRIYSMLTSLVIAILTDSALLIQWNEIENYIEEPLYCSFLNNCKFNDFDDLNFNYTTDNSYHPHSLYAWRYNL